MYECGKRFDFFVSQLLFGEVPAGKAAGKKNENCPAFPDKVEIHEASRKDLAVQACNFFHEKKIKWCLQIRSMIVFGSRERW